MRGTRSEATIPILRRILQMLPVCGVHSILMGNNFMNVSLTIRYIGNMKHGQNKTKIEHLMQNTQRKYSKIINHREMRSFRNFWSEVIENCENQNDETIEKLYFTFHSLSLHLSVRFSPKKKIFSGYSNETHSTHETPDENQYGFSTQGTTYNSVCVEYVQYSNEHGNFLENVTISESSIWQNLIVMTFYSED